MVENVVTHLLKLKRNACDSDGTLYNVLDSIDTTDSTVLDTYYYYKMASLSSGVIMQNMLIKLVSLCSPSVNVVSPDENENFGDSMRRI